MGVVYVKLWTYLPFFLLFIMIHAETTAQPAQPYVYFFAHGLADTHQQAFRLADWYVNLQGIVIRNIRHTLGHPLVTFDFPDSKLWQPTDERYIPFRQKWRHLVKGNYSQTSFGQENEIARLHEVYISKIKPDEQVIAGGVSRGASILIPYLAIHKPSNIAAAVLESPFDSMHSVVTKIREKVSKYVSVSDDQAHTILEYWFSKYKRNGIRPIDFVDGVSTDIPLLIICAKTDVLVPYESSIKLYNAFRAHGHTKAHILVLNKGRHGFLLNGEDGDKYEQVTHAFYKQYDLPHNPELAQKGYADFTKTQP